MSTRILLIDAEGPFAAEISRALEAEGLDVRVTGDGASGIDLARDARPDAIVLCVELPKMSGYAVCQRVRKDEALKAIPLVLTSSEATPETFENHRRLKVRADAYLHKPFDGARLLDALRGLVQLPAPVPVEEIVTLDDVEELSGELPLEPAPRPPPAPAPAAEDEDLKLLDSAFDQIAGEPPARPAAAPPPLPVPAAARAAVPDAGDEQPLGGEELRLAAELLPVEDEAAHGAIDRLGEEADRALAALGAEEVVTDLALDARALLDEPPPSPPLPPSGDRDELLRAAGIHVAPAEPPGPPPVPAAVRDEEVRRLEGRVAELLAESARAREAAAASAEEAARLRAGAEELEARLRGVEADREGRESEARRTGEEALAREAERAEAARAEAGQEADRRRQAEEALARAEERVRRAEEARARADEERARAEEDRQRAEAARAGAEEARGQAEGARARAEEEARRAGERNGSLEAELAALRLRVEEAEQAHGLKAAQLAEASGQRDALGQRLAALEGELSGALALRPQLEALRGELDLARAEADGARVDAERRAAERDRRIAELEAVNAKHEERIVKAYQKIKSDEKIREKTRKALAIALQLLDERLAAAPGTPRESEPAPRRE